MSEHHDRADEHASDDSADAGQAPDDRTGDDSPTGGDALTESQLDADNAVEEDQLRALDPGASTG
jgi:hypothetical protein